MYLDRNEKKILKIIDNNQIENYAFNYNIQEYLLNRGENFQPIKNINCIILNFISYLGGRRFLVQLYIGENENRINSIREIDTIKNTGSIPVCEIHFKDSNGVIENFGLTNKILFNE